MPYVRSDMNQLNYLLTFLNTESSNRMTDRIRSRWLLVVDESVSSDDVSTFCCCSKIVSVLDLSMLELFVEWRIGLTRACIKGLSGDSSAKGIFSPNVNGRLVGCRWVILLITENLGLVIWRFDEDWSEILSSLSEESTDEFLSDLSLLSNSAVTVAVRDDSPEDEKTAVKRKAKKTAEKRNYCETLTQENIKGC